MKNSISNQNLFLVLLSFLAIGITGGCIHIDQHSGLQDLNIGESIAFGGGTVKSYIAYTDSGEPRELAVVLSETAMNNLPADFTSVSIPLPTNTQTPYTHIGFDWLPSGHEPSGVYDTAHFDIHFYMIPEAERLLIEADDSIQFQNFPPQGSLPSYYFSDGIGVPQMGTHWVNLLSPESSGQAFTQTLVYGTYDGKVIFHEPMITKDFWANISRHDNAPGASDKFSIPQPSIYPVVPAYYPTAYKIIHNEVHGTYSIIMTDFKYVKN